ncbi:AI-2E family transporter [Methanococcoides sp. SA1]|nr:AI-2E family transporter [Methanococcoides sp. SA1]
MIKERTVKLALALLSIIILAVVLSYALLPYINAFLGAFILYVIFKPVYILLTERLKLKENISAILVMILSMILVVLPLYYMFTLIIGEIEMVISNITTNLSYVDFTNNFDIVKNIDYINEIAPDIDIQGKIVTVISTLGSYLSKHLIGAVQNISGLLISVTIMLFLLYYLFTSTNTNISNRLQDLIPFNKRNTNKLLTEMKNIIQSTLIATLLIAVLQGTIIGVTFYAVGINGATLWAAVTTVLSFLPVVGAPLVWVPAVLFKLITQDYVAAIVILVAGIILSNIDNVLRPYIQKKVGAMHPFVSLLGIFVGIYLFGLVGIVVGPLLISAFLLILKMFNEEYIQN